MGLGDWLIIGFILLNIYGWIIIARAKYTDKHVCYDLFLERADGAVIQLASDQKPGSFYILNGVLCYFDERHIKMYLPLEPDCKVFYERRSIKSKTPAAEAD